MVNFPPSGMASRAFAATNPNYEGKDKIVAPQAAAETQTRAVRIRPEIVKSITPVDMNIVFQRLPVPPEKAFDLIIGTNIFVYYGEFEQWRARANVAAMLKPGG